MGEIYNFYLISEKIVVEVQRIAKERFSIPGLTKNPRES
jgi:hypothetical protein